MKNSIGLGEGRGLEATKKWMNSLLKDSNTACTVHGEAQRVSSTRVCVCGSVLFETMALTSSSMKCRRPHTVKKGRALPKRGMLSCEWVS